MVALEQNVFSENIFNFLILYLNEKHTKTTTQNQRRLNYTRTLFFTTQFYQILFQDQGIVFRDRLRELFISFGNIFINYDYIYIPIFSGTLLDEYNLVIVDLNNKVFILFLTSKTNQEYEQ